MKHIMKPWGYEDIWEVNEIYQGKKVHILKGHNTSTHLHQKKDESLYLNKGYVTIELFDQNKKKTSSVKLVSGDMFKIAPNVIHRICALESSDIFEVSAPDQGDKIYYDDSIINDK